MEIVQKWGEGELIWIKMIILHESNYICNKAGVYISHTDLTDLTEIFDKYNKDTLFRLLPPLSVFGMCAVNSLENKLSVISLHTSLPSY